MLTSWLAIDIQLITYRKYMLKAINAQGCDRHLLGLKLIAMEEGMKPLPAIFNEAYKESCTWRLSTSSIPCQSYTPGFAAVVNDGYGICYNPRAHRIQSTVCSWFSCKETSSVRMRDAFKESLLEMQNLFLKESKL